MFARKTIIATLFIVLLTVISGCGNAAPTTIPPTTIPPTANSGATIAPNALAGTIWSLVSYGKVPTGVVAAAPITLQFGPDNAISGSSGCNDYAGSATLDGQNMTIGPLISTEKACLEQPLNTQEAAFLNGLQNSQSFAAADTTLTIGYPDGVLIWGKQQNQDTLEGTTWNLESYGPAASPVLPLETMTLVFGANNAISGKAVCNSYFSNATISGNTISIEPVGSTEMSCGDAGNLRELAFRKALGSAQTFTATDTTLSITYPDGVLIWRRQ